MTPPVDFTRRGRFLFLLFVFFQLFRFLYLYLRILSENRRRGVRGGQLLYPFSALESYQAE